VKNRTKAIVGCDMKELNLPVGIIKGIMGCDMKKFNLSVDINKRDLWALKQRN
jgi:hypothetical protein